MTRRSLLPVSRRTLAESHPGLAVRGRFAATLSLLIGALVAAGCATPAPRPPQAHAFIGQPVQVVVSESPNFYADNKRRRWFGLAGVAAMALEGNRLVKTHGLVDPSQALGEALRESIAERARFSQPLAAGAGPMTVAALSDSRALQPSNGSANRADALGSEGAKGAMELRVRTTNWEYRPFRGDPKQFFVIYEARIDLVDVKSGRIVGTDRCEVTPTTDMRLTEEELIADDARKLKEELAIAGNQCFAILSSGRVAAALGMSAPVADATASFPD